MFEFMDGVVDALEETGKVVVDGVVYCLICVAKLALIITAPVWVLPYTIWRKGRNGLNGSQCGYSERRYTVCVYTVLYATGQAGILTGYGRRAV